MNFVGIFYDFGGLQRFGCYLRQPTSPQPYHPQQTSAHMPFKLEDNEEHQNSFLIPLHSTAPTCATPPAALLAICDQEHDLKNEIETANRRLPGGYRTGIAPPRKRPRRPAIARPFPVSAPQPPALSRRHVRQCMCMLMLLFFFIHFIVEQPK